MCNFHLIYLGRGLFVELTERKWPLTIVEENADTKIVIIGKLTFNEQDTLNKVIYRGLGFGVDRSGVQLRSLPHTAGHEINRGITIKDESEADTTLIDYEKLEHEFNLKRLSIKCNRAEVTQYLESKHQLVQGESTTNRKCEKTVHVHVHKLNLGTLTSIKLSPDMLWKLHTPVDYDSDKTEDYWSLDHEHPTVFEPILVSEPKKAVKTLKRRIRSKPSKGGFNISVHGVKKRKRRTYLSCKVAGCKTKFNSVKAWNAHHCWVHRDTLLKCYLCNIHSDKAFKCNLCSRVFTFKSSLRIHHRTHLKARLFKCFAKNCTREYKWAQDLHRHVQKHLKCGYGCNICDYTTYEKRLIKRHCVKHEGTTYYNCANCDYKCKYYTQWTWHVAKCDPTK